MMFLIILKRLAAVKHFCPAGSGVLWSGAPIESLVIPAQARIHSAVGATLRREVHASQEVSEARVGGPDRKFRLRPQSVFLLRDQR
jgi:hypothetical protein